MSVAKEKTWTHYKETYGGDDDYDVQYRHVMYLIKCFLVSAGAVVVSSCDEDTVHNNDNVDLWTDETKLKWDYSGYTHSWIVLRFLGRYFLIDCIQQSSYGDVYRYNALFSVSDSILTAGTTSAAPTSPSSRSVLVNGGGVAPTYWCCGLGATPNLQFQFHGMYRTNGLRLFLSCAGSTGLVLLWEYLEDVRGVPQPTLMVFKGNLNSSCILASLNATALTSGFSICVTEMALVGGGGWSDTQVTLAARDQQADDYYNGWNIEIISGTGDGDQRVISDYDNASNTATVSVPFGAALDATSEYMLHPHALSAGMGRAYMTAPYSGLGTDPAATTGADDWDDTWPFSTIRIISDTTGHRWCRGRIPDLYWGPTANANGQLFDTEVVPDWVQYGNLIVPNDGSTPCPVT